MNTLGMLLMLGLASFLVAWLVNGLVGLLMGERPRDTGSLWLDTFFRVFLLLELGWIGRVLTYAGFSGSSRKLLLFLGCLCVVLFLAKDCRQEHNPNVRSFPVESQ
jgi:hypothetical protein